MKKKLQNQIVVPPAAHRRFYGHGIPGITTDDLVGKLIVVEGADGSGRSTQIARLVEWLETTGHATVQVGLKRSTLVSDELDRAQVRAHAEERFGFQRMVDDYVTIYRRLIAG